MQRNGYLGVPPAYTGVVFLLSWIYLLFYASSAGIEAAAPISLMSAGYTISATTMVVSLMVCAFLPVNRTKLLTSKAAKVAVPLVMSGGTALLVLSSFGANGLEIVWAGGVLTGLASGAMTQQWMTAYRRVGLGAAINSFPTLMAMAVGICMTLLYLPRPALLAATIAFPLISAALFHAVRKDPWPRDEIDQGPRDRPLNFAMLLFPFAIYSIASGFLDFYSSSSNYTFAFYALMAFIPLAASGVSIFRNARSGFMATFCVPTAFLAVVFVPFLALGGLEPLSQFVSVGELGIEVVNFVVIVGFAEFFALDVLKTSALGKLVVVACNTLGWYIAAYAGTVYDALWNSQASMLVIFVGIEVFAVFLIVALVKVQGERTPPRPTLTRMAFARMQAKRSFQSPHRRASRCPKELWTAASNPSRSTHSA